MSPHLDYDPASRSAVLAEVRALLVQDRVSDPASALTNGVLIEAVCHLVLEALEGRGKVIIADVPLQSADFEAVIALNGLRGVMERFVEARAPVALLDLRQERLMI